MLFNLRLYVTAKTNMQVFSRSWISTKRTLSTYVSKLSVCYICVILKQKTFNGSHYPNCTKIWHKVIIIIIIIIIIMQSTFLRCGPVE